MEILNQSLCFLFMSSAGAVQGLLLEHMLTPRQGRKGRNGRIAYWLLAFGIVALFQVTANGRYNYVWMALPLYLGMSAWGLYRFYQDRWRKRIAAPIILYFAWCTSVLGFFVLKLFRDVELYPIDYGRTMLVMAVAAGTMLGVAVMILVGFLWSRFDHRADTIRHVWVFLLFPLGQELPILYLDHSYWNGRMNLLAAVLLVKTLLLDLVMLFFLFNQAEKDAMERELQDIRHQSERERLHYEELETRRETMAKLRHDYNNQITSALGLIQMGREAEASELLGEMARRREETGDAESIS